ncbi:hypothetical protein MTP99_014529 [Tenebrio molitor]|nr:hypothetical protein MTP99_014529 [Tenebrio molitor]
MRQGRAGQRKARCLSRRVAPPITLPVTLEDPATTWKGPPPGSEPQNFATNAANSFSGPPAGFQGPSPFQGPPAGAGSPAGAPPYQGGPPPGSTTPQYTASPAPSGSSTPGPGPPQSVGNAFPPPPNSAGPPYNGPGPGPFGSPSAGGPPFGRPGSSGPPFVGGPGPGGNPHFASPGQPFAPGFGIPPGSPFGPGPGHPMSGPMEPGHGIMARQMPGPIPVDQGVRSVVFRIWVVNASLVTRSRNWGFSTQRRKCRPQGDGYSSAGRQSRATQPSNTAALSPTLAPAGVQTAVDQKYGPCSAVSVREALRRGETFLGKLRESCHELGCVGGGGMLIHIHNRRYRDLAGISAATTTANPRFF